MKEPLSSIWLYAIEETIRRIFHHNYGCCNKCFKNCNKCLRGK